MGHYRSEMGFEDEDARQHKAKLDRIKKMADHIERAIERKGVTRVLAEILEQNNTGSYCWLSYRDPDQGS